MEVLDEWEISKLGTCEAAAEGSSGGRAADQPAETGFQAQSQGPLNT
jgi:hypothetical protein